MLFCKLRFNIKSSKKSWESLKVTFSHECCDCNHLLLYL